MSDTTTHFDAESFLKTLPVKPGVYRMLDTRNEVLYVGKAKNLKNRVSSYFQKNHPNAKTRVLVSKIQHIEITITHTDNEALLLENNLIKTLKPRYNVLFRDDKSYPFIFLSSQDAFPRLSLHRGTKRKQGQYFGPYPSAGAVRETLGLLQKVFRIRQCEDSFYKNRTRPCLQYQIKRCTAPCTGLINQQDYARDIRHVSMFLKGKSNAVIEERVQAMEVAAKALDYERAAQLRDQIVSLRRITEKQYMSTEGGDSDVIAAAIANGVGCIQVVTIRGGHSLGSKAFFPKLHANVTQALTESELLEIFIPQYYLATDKQASQHVIPSEVITSHTLPDSTLLKQVLTEQAGHNVAVKQTVRGTRNRWLNMAIENARQSLLQHLQSKATLLARFEQLHAALDLAELPQRIECFDISHTGGEATVASCVVITPQGFVKNDYRRFNINDIGPGDDYAAMHQALMRRYKRIKKGEARLPDILLIDGGKGQVKQAEQVMQELQIAELNIVGISKGPGRKPKYDSLYIAYTGKKQHLAADSGALHLLQQLRDEAHRFAIAGHRQKRKKARNTSVLETIPGLGVKRRQQLLKQFGGLQEVARAGVEDLAGISGISAKLAQLIYDAFHNETNESA